MFLPSSITLKPGDSGDFVAELQRRLAAMDCYNHDAVNGFYDGMTTNAVSSFQSRTGIATDGIAGPETLRRLNGAVSGDTSTSSSDNKQEEEAKQQAAAQFFQPPVIEAPVMSPAAAIEPVREIAAGVDPFAPAAVPSQFTPPPQAISAEQQLQHQLEQQMLREPRAQQQVLQPETSAHLLQAAGSQQAPAQMAAPQPSAADTLAHMLLQTPPPAAAVAASAQPTQAAARAPEQAAQTQTPPQHAPVTAAAQSAPAAAQVSHAQPVQAAQAAAPEQAQQPRSMVGRAVQYASDVVQKLANYFEAKLPPSVISEVQAIGQSMMRNGVKEVPIPAEPTPLRTQELPARAPQQAPAPQRT